MCQARVYFCRNSGEGERLVMEDVALVEIEGEVCILCSLFGEQQRIRGRITRIDLLRHAIYVEEEGNV